MNPGDGAGRLFAPETARLVVLSHPNHELAIWGFLSRFRPHLVFLTDGGDPARIAQTRSGLERLGAHDRAAFFDYSEADFYDALVACDVAFFRGVAARLSEQLVEVRAEFLVCDAIEFYNPVHDLALPLVQAAAPQHPASRVFEVPLIYQVPGDTEDYVVQRVPASGSARRASLELTDSETLAKRRARDEVYDALGEQLGPVLANLSDSHLSNEEFAASGRALRPAPRDVLLRYDRRGERLRGQGHVRTAITLESHYKPLVASLLGN